MSESLVKENGRITKRYYQYYYIKSLDIKPFTSPIEPPSSSINLSNCLTFSSLRNYYNNYKNDLDYGTKKIIKTFINQKYDENCNVFTDTSQKENDYKIHFLVPIYKALFKRNEYIKKDWGETAIKNTKVDGLLNLLDEEGVVTMLSVVEVSGPWSAVNYTHFMNSINISNTDVNIALSDQDRINQEWCNEFEKSYPYVFKGTLYTLPPIRGTDGDMIGSHKGPRCFKTKAGLLALTAIGRKHYVEYHHSTNAWMTFEIFALYIKKLDIAFCRDSNIRKVKLYSLQLYNKKFYIYSLQVVYPKIYIFKEEMSFSYPTSPAFFPSQLPVFIDNIVKFKHLLDSSASSMLSSRNMGLCISFRISSSASFTA